MPVEYTGLSIFTNVNQPVTVLADSDNMLALACHNCYQNNNDFLADSLYKVESAIAEGADLIELDITLSDDEGVVFKVSHENESAGASFKQLIAQPSLVNSDQLLFLEIKGEIKTLELVREFLTILKAHRHTSGRYAYLNDSRFVTLRNIDNNNTLARFRTVLAEPNFSDIKKYVKLSRLYYKKTEVQMYQEITTAHQCGFHMIELDIRLGFDVIMSLNAYAEGLGLSVNVFTLNQDNFEELTLVLKHDVDVLTIEDGDMFESTGYSLIYYIKQLISE
jgi:glycerophosphoryl diester phosphodiesterase